MTAQGSNKEVTLKPYACVSYNIRQVLHLLSQIPSKPYACASCNPSGSELGIFSDRPPSHTLV